MPRQEEIEELELRLLLEAIHLRYGYDLRDYAQPSMARRFQSVLAKSGARNFGDLQHNLMSDKQFFASVLDELTVQVSEMFRSPAFFRAFREHVVPDLRTYPLVKIWHAGCAGGEEVYSTAILLSEENLIDRTLFYATDLSESALDRARAGVYSEERARLFAENYRASGAKARFDDYSSKAYGRMGIKESVRRNILFFQHDLCTDYAFGEMNVVFCRNVLIYFTPKLRDRVLDTFAKSLTRGGFLCLGESERLSDAERKRFVPFRPAESIFRLASDAGSV